MHNDPTSRMIRAFMVHLVERAGGVENAARLIALQQGLVPDPLSNRDDLATRKGTISKRLSGQLDWPISEVWALEEALGEPLVSRWRAQQLPEVAHATTLAAEASAAAREGGEAIAAVLGIVGGGGDTIAARREVHQAVQSFSTLAARLDAGSES